LTVPSIAAANPPAQSRSCVARPWLCKAERVTDSGLVSLGILKSVSPRVQKLSDLNRLPGDMSEHSRPYVIHSDDECERLELQSRLAKIDQHLKYLSVSPRDRVLDAGCGSGSMSRLIARSFPEAEVTGVDLGSRTWNARDCGRAQNNFKTFNFKSLMSLPCPLPTPASTLFGQNTFCNG
jgi:hypothetical protein